MLTDAEISDALTSAEQAFSQQLLRDAWAALQPVVNEIRSLGSVVATYSSATLARLGKILRDITNNLDEENLHSEAQEVFEKSLSWYPNNASLLNGQGWC